MATNRTNHRRSPAASSARARTSGSATPGIIPGVVYGHKEAVVPVTLPKKELVDHLDHGDARVRPGLDGKSEKVLVKEVQYDHLGLEVIHVDFARVSASTRRSRSPCRSSSRASPRAKRTAACSSRSSASWRSSASSPTSPTDPCTTSRRWSSTTSLHIKDLKLPPGVQGAAGRGPDRGAGEGDRGRSRRPGRRRRSRRARSHRPQARGRRGSRRRAKARRRSRSRVASC